MPGLSGHRGAISLDPVSTGPATFDTATAGLLKNWERTVEESEINLDTQGDAWEDSEHLRSRWMVRAEYDFDATSYGSCGNLVGLDVLLVLQADQSQEGGTTPAPFFKGTGRVARDTSRANTADRVTGEVEIRGKGMPDAN